MDRCLTEYMQKREEKDSKRKVFLASSDAGLKDAIFRSLSEIGVLDRIKNNCRVALKPNLTYPYYKAGVTTSPDFIRETVLILRQYTSNISIVETDGGYGAWSASEAFSGHGLFDLGKQYDVEVINLCDEAREFIDVNTTLGILKIPLPTRLLHKTDVFLTLPVPKIHAMTGITLSYKNQWGCIPDIMRLRNHYIFNDAIIAINRALRTQVLSDGTYFLDDNGPLDGIPVKMDMVISATDCGSFDRYVSELMGIRWQTIPHLKNAVKLGDMPSDLVDIAFNISPKDAKKHTFKLQRTIRNRISLLGFRSKYITWLGYESWFGKSVLHPLLYAIYGENVKPKP